MRYRCSWCLSTPPRHDRCYGDEDYELVKVGDGLDRNGAYIPLYERVPHPCDCECRDGLLW